MEIWKKKISSFHTPLSSRFWKPFSAYKKENTFQIAHFFSGDSSISKYILENEAFSTVEMNFCYIYSVKFLLMYLQEYN